MRRDRVRRRRPWTTVPGDVSGVRVAGKFAVARPLRPTYPVLPSQAGNEGFGDTHLGAGGWAWETIGTSVETLRASSATSTVRAGLDMRGRPRDRGTKSSAPSRCS